MLRLIILSLVSLIFVSPCWAFTGAPKDDANCQGAWLFLEGSGTEVVDSSQNSHTGTFKGAGEPAWAAISGTGAPSYATYMVDFGEDGTADEQIDTTSEELKTANNITIVLWFKTDSTSYTRSLVWQGWQGSNMWGDPNGTDPEMHLGFGYWTGAQLNDYVHMFMGKENDIADVISKATAFSDTTEWHHLAAVFSDLAGTPTGELFLDGVSQGTEAGTAAEMDRSSWDIPFRIGRPDVADRYFDGKMTEVAIFDRALNQTEIQEIIDYGLAPVVAARPQLISITEN